MMEHLNSTPVDAGKIKALIDRDPILSCVRDGVLRGWPVDLRDPKFATTKKSKWNSASKIAAFSGKTESSSHPRCQCNVIFIAQLPCRMTGVSVRCYIASVR